MLVRGDGLERSMSHYLIEQIRAIDNIVVRPNASVVAVAGGTGSSGSPSRTPPATPRGPRRLLRLRLHRRAPRTDWLGGVVQRDARGFVCTGPDLLSDGERPKGWPLDRDPFYLETSVPGVFVAGDVRAESVKRVASAVGEGAMAVTLVHRYIDKVTT
jgi:thioredoxin reductase (NADPH)